MGQVYSPQEPCQGSHSCAVSLDLSRHSGGPTSVVTVLVDLLLAGGGGVGTHTLGRALCSSRSPHCCCTTACAYRKLCSMTHRRPRADPLELVELTVHVFCPLCAVRGPSKVYAVAATAA